jgi:hypothetical protein
MKNDPLTEGNVHGQLWNALARAANCIDQRLRCGFCETEPRTQPYVDGGLPRAKLLCGLKDWRDHEPVFALAPKASQKGLNEERAHDR